MSYFNPTTIGLVVLLGFLIYLFIALYIYAPFVIRKQQVKELSPKYLPIDLSNLPAEFTQLFHSAFRQLESHGFVSLGLATQQVVRTKQVSYLALLINPTLGDQAQIIGIFTPSPYTSAQTMKLVTFLTEFDDGTSIVTSNTASPSCFPADSNVSAVRCAGIEDLELLYKFHRARVDHDRGSRKPTLGDVKDPVSRLQFEHVKTFDRLVRVGYYVRDDVALCYFPTHKGAFLMTYWLLPPLKQIQMRQKQRVADRTLRNLGFGGLEQFRNSQTL